MSLVERNSLRIFGSFKPLLPFTEKTATIMDAKNLILFENLHQELVQPNANVLIGVVATKINTQTMTAASSLGAPKFSFENLNEYSNYHDAKDGSNSLKEPLLMTAWNYYDCGTIAKVKSVKKLSPECFKVTLSASNTQRFIVNSTNRDCVGSWQANVNVFDDNFNSYQEEIDSIGHDCIEKIASILRTLKNKTSHQDAHNSLPLWQARDLKRCFKEMNMVEQLRMVAPKNFKNAWIKPLMKVSFVLPSVIGNVPYYVLVEILRSKTISERISLIEPFINDWLNQSSTQQTNQPQQPASHDEK